MNTHRYIKKLVYLIITASKKQAKNVRSSQQDFRQPMEISLLWDKREASGRRKGVSLHMPFPEDIQHGKAAALRGQYSHVFIAEMIQITA